MKIKDEKQDKKAGTYNISKDETSGGSGSGSGQSFWDKLLQTILPKGGGR